MKPRERRPAGNKPIQRPTPYSTWQMPFSGETEIDKKKKMTAQMNFTKGLGMFFGVSMKF